MFSSAVRGRFSAHDPSNDKFDGSVHFLRRLPLNGLAEFLCFGLQPGRLLPGLRFGLSQRGGGLFLGRLAGTLFFPGGLGFCFGQDLLGLVPGVFQYLFRRGLRLHHLFDGLH